MSFCLKRIRIFLPPEEMKCKKYIGHWIVSLVLGMELSLLLALNKHYVATEISRTGKTFYMLLVLMQNYFFSVITNRMLA